MAEVILVQAINAEGELSSPIKVYDRTGKKLPAQFVMRVSEGGVSKSGTEQTKVSSFKLGLVATHSSDYVEEKLTGFRRMHEDDVYILATRFKDNEPLVKDISPDCF